MRCPLRTGAPNVKIKVFTLTSGWKLCHLRSSCFCLSDFCTKDTSTFMSKPLTSADLDVCPRPYPLRTMALSKCARYDNSFRYTPRRAGEIHCRKVFAVQRSNRKFSAIALDHCHEKNNATVKGSGGVVGLSQNPGALSRWMVVGKEISRIIAEFEDQLLREQENIEIDRRHHEQQPGVQTAFLKDVKSLTSVIEEMGQLFPWTKWRPAGIRF